MSSPAGPSITELQWFVQQAAVGGLQIPVARLRFKLSFQKLASAGALFAEWCWVDTGAPLCVVPFWIQTRGLSWQAIPGVTVTWSGQPSALGHIDVWLPTAPAGVLRGPLRMLAKFPHSDPPGPLPPVLLGLEFMLARRVALVVDPPPGQAFLRIP